MQQGRKYQFLAPSVEQY